MGEMPAIIQPVHRGIRKETNGSPGLTRQRDGLGLVLLAPADDDPALQAPGGCPLLLGTLTRAARAGWIEWTSVTDAFIVAPKTLDRASVQKLPGSRATVLPA